MKNSKVFPVFLVGVAGSKQKTLERIFHLANGQTRAYEIKRHSAAGKNSITIIDHDKRHAVKMWDSITKHNPEKATSPVVYVGSDSNMNVKPKYFVKKPYSATQMLKVLNQVTALEFNFIPELNVGVKSDMTAIPGDELEQLLIPKDPAGVKIPRYSAMVVDDSQMVRTQLRIELKLQGFEVDFAENGKAAARLLSSGKSYDIIFLDVMMPGVDGYCVCKQFKNSGLVKNTPIVLLTSKSSRIDKIKGTFARCDDYLTKPLDRKTFEGIIEKYFPASNNVMPLQTAHA